MELPADATPRTSRGKILNEIAIRYRSLGTEIDANLYKLLVGTASSDLVKNMSKSAGVLLIKLADIIEQAAYLDKEHD